MENTTLPSEIKSWLNGRGISDAVIDRARIYFDGDLVIPIIGEGGDVLFEKRRRDPRITDESIPKYKNAQGAEAALYKPHVGNFDGPFVICEGELDALVLASHGIRAATSTGGSQTFKPEWAELFNEMSPLICFDRDRAGIQGSIKLQELIPSAGIVWLPYKMEGKDITDYIKQFGIDEFRILLGQAKRYPIPPAFEAQPEKKEIKKKADEYKIAIEYVTGESRAALQSGAWAEPYIEMLEYLTKRYDHYTRLYKSFNRTGERDPNRVKAAKAVPLDRFIKFNMRGFAPCIWHSEKTPSMKYNREGSKHPNTVKCFGCGMMGDPIDVVMKLDNLDFKAAIKKILAE